MAIPSKTNIGEIARMPDSTMEELRLKVATLIRAIVEEFKHVESKVT